MDTTHFINFSGGVDSTYYLWKWLKENRNSKIAVHHCLLYQSRRVVEKQATDAILAYFRKQGLTNFDYVETEFSRKGLSSLLYDIEVVFFMGGLALKKFSKVHTIIMSRCREELVGNAGLSKHFQTKDACLNNFFNAKNRVSVAVQTIQLLAYRKIAVISPYQNMPKAEMIKEMPKELFDLTWYCRKPKEGKPCGKCFNCRRVSKTIKTEGGGDAYKPSMTGKSRIHKYWQSPDDGANGPKGYFKGVEKSEFLFGLVEARVDKDATLFEPGCNVGRNLNYLWERGYKNISGLDISEPAVKELRAAYPDMDIPITVAPLESAIKELSEYDVVFTMAVLEHIHTDSDWVFAELARITGKYLITIEDEVLKTWRHFPRNYKVLFEGFGLKQVAEQSCKAVPGLGKRFVARTFEKV